MLDVLFTRCHCGKMSYRLRCGESDLGGRSCNQVCNLELGCGAHKCSQICHEGPCLECEILVKQHCYCGRVTEDRLCGSGELDTGSSRGGRFSCETACGKELPCGNHRCTLLCHPGDCPQCSLSPSVVSEFHCTVAFALNTLTSFAFGGYNMPVWAKGAVHVG